MKVLNKNHWYKNAVFYGVDVEVFYDGNGDGYGDFVGVTKKLDYLYSLGITAIWLLPINDTPDRDNGYDVRDYYSIDARLGTMKDFEMFVKEAKSRGIRVIMDLVVHHTSDEHPWFQEACKDTNSKFYNYYVWTDTVPEKQELGSAFPGIETGVWTFNPEAKRYYYHSFYRFQPDLNVANPAVQDEIKKIIDFWISKGVCGFRMDAAHFMFMEKGLPGTDVPKFGEFLEEIHSRIVKKNPDAILLAEADVTADQIQPFFDNGGRMQLMYNFILNRYIFLALAKGDATPIKESLRKLPIPSPDGQWVNFLRNLDELNIERLTKEEKEEVFKEFGNHPYYQVYGRGIRRRLAPMFGGDMRRLRMVFSLLFSLPGAVLFPYGDEIGMGEDLQLTERVAVRTPMQWNKSDSAGFSQADPRTIIRGVINEGPYRYEKTNVEDEERDSGSLLNAIREMITIRKAHHQIGYGAYKILDADPSQVFSVVYDFEGNTYILTTNLSEKPCVVSLNEYKNTVLEDFFSDGMYNKTEIATNIPINGFGYRWFQVKKS